MEKGLSAKRSRFVDEYLIDLNAKQAAIRAGYSVRRAEVTGCELLANRKVSEAVAAKMAEREERTHITSDRVLQELSRIAFFDLRKLYREDGSLKAMHELDDDAAAVLAGVDVVEMAGGAGVGGEGGLQHVPMFTKKTKIPDKVAALSLAMRYLGMLTDKTQLSGPGGGPLAHDHSVRLYMPDNGRSG